MLQPRRCYRRPVGIMGVTKTCKLRLTRRLLKEVKYAAQEQQTITELQVTPSLALTQQNDNNQYNNKIYMYHKEQKLMQHHKVQPIINIQ